MIVTRWQISRLHGRAVLWSMTLLVALLLCVLRSVRAEEDTLVFSVRRWEGEYESHDVPGGVESTPSTSSIHSVRVDGTEARELVAIEDAAWLR